MKTTMTYHQLPEGIRETELDAFISNYEWLKREITREEAIQLLETTPLEVTDVSYGIHGHMVKTEWRDVHYSIYAPELFGREKEEVQ